MIALTHLADALSRPLLTGGELAALRGLCDSLQTECLGRGLTAEFREIYEGARRGASWTT